MTLNFCMDKGDLVTTLTVNDVPPGSYIFSITAEIDHQLVTVSLPVAISGMPCETLF